ncbi:MAG TPA: cyclase family protein [Capsulimonadaceae bacterium]|jgi:arylformamidase
MSLIDISLNLNSSLVTWKGEDAGLRLRWVDQFGIDGSENCTSEVRFGSHLGTHLDAPLHFIPGGGTVDQISPDVLVGGCYVADLMSFSNPEITVEALDAASIPSGTRRLLLKTANSANRLLNDSQFHDEFVAIGPDAAQWIVAQGIALVGVDYLSVGSATTGNGSEVHRALLGAGIVAVEGLNLTNVAPGPYTLICLPLKVVGAEGAPVRALLATPGHFDVKS